MPKLFTKIRLTDVPHDIDDALVDARVRTDLQERVRP